MQQIYLSGAAFHDLNPLFAGIEQCKKGKSFGPAIREYTLIHYILSGSGFFQKDHDRYPVNPGQVFIIHPGELTYYEADTARPWHYLWIAFNGALTQKLFELDTPVASVPGEIFEPILNCIDQKRPDSFLVLSCIYRLLGALLDQAPSAADYPQFVRQYIDMRYMEPLSIEGIAGQIHLNRRYLTRLFKKKYGITIRDYLTQVRMEHAKKYLRQGFSVRETASMVGYGDMFNFSKLFKKFTGVSPSRLQKPSIH